MLKAIHAGEDIVAAHDKAVRVIEKLRGLRLTLAAELAEAGVEETLTYCGSAWYFFWRGRPRGEAWRDGWKRRQVPHSCLAGLRRSRTPSLGDLVFHRATMRA